MQIEDMTAQRYKVRWTNKETKATGFLTARYSEKDAKEAALDYKHSNSKFTFLVVPAYESL